MGIALAILGTLGMIAGSIGAEHVISLINRTKSQVAGLSTDQILARLKTIVAMTNREDSAAAARMSDAIAASPYSASWSGVARQYITKAKSTAADIQRQYEQKVADRDVVNERISTFAMQPDSYKNSAAGKADLASIEQSISGKTGVSLNQIRATKQP